jgi:excisionase family DNA binding protein
MTTTEAAALLGVQPKTVSRYIKRGLIKAEKRGRDYWITVAELDRFKAARRGRGRPRNELVSSQGIEP